MPAEAETRRRIEPEGVLAALPVGVLVVGLDLSVLGANPAAGSLIGLAHEELAGRSWMDLFPEASQGDGFPLPAANPAGHPPDGPVRRLVGRRRLPAGDLAWFEVEASPVFESDGGLRQVVCTFRDVTGLHGAGAEWAGWRERLRVEELLLQARSEWTATVDTVTDMIFLEDSAGRVLRCNRAAARFFGANFTEILGRRLDDLFFAVRQDDGGPVEVHPWFRAETAVAQLPGGDRWYEITNYPLAVPIARGGAGWVHVIKDVTARRRLEAIAEAVNMMDSVGTIFSSLRHELGNPVNSIKTALSVLRKNLGQFPPETVESYLDRTLEEVGRVEYMLRALRSFNVHETPRVERLDLSRFLADFCALVREDFAGQGIAVEPEVRGEVEAALADPRALHQVLLNLLTNAADALAGRPEPRIVLRLERGVMSVDLTVADNGAGIPEAERAQLFRPFHTSKPHGTGLGLVIVKKLVTQMGGTIEVASEPGVGTEVKISLAAAEGVA